MFESNYNYVPNPYPPAPAPGPGPMPPGPMPPGPTPGPWYPPHPHPHPGPGPMPPIYIDPTLSVPGAAAEASVTGQLIASKVDLSSLSGNIQLIDDKLELLGLAEAQVGQVPSKGEDGSLVWIPVPSVEDIENLQSQITSINSEITEINSDINQLFETNSQQTEAISNLTLLVNNNNARVDAIENQFNDIVHSIEELANDKLDAETFNNFLEQYNELMNDPDEGILARLVNLEAGLAELQNCCHEVQDILDHVIGDVHNYEQPIYEILQDFETHAQAISRDIDGGDLDDEIVMVEVPDVVGKEAAVASLILGQAGFFTDASHSGESYTGQKIVESQDPVAGSQAPEGSLVELEFVEEVEP